MNWEIVISAGLALSGVTLTALVSRRKNTTDGALGFVAVLQAERATAVAAAERAEDRLERAERARRRFEILSWKYHQQLSRAGIEPDPSWPTVETPKVTVQ